MSGVALGLKFNKMPACEELRFWANITALFPDATWIKLIRLNLCCSNKHSSHPSDIMKVYFLLIQSQCQVRSWAIVLYIVTWWSKFLWLWALPSEHVAITLPKKEEGVGSFHQSFCCPSPSGQRVSLTGHHLELGILGDWEVQSSRSPGGEKWMLVNTRDNYDDSTNKQQRHPHIPTEN